jgi:hypothetical protein
VYSVWTHWVILSQLLHAVQKLHHRKSHASSNHVTFVMDSDVLVGVGVKMVNALASKDFLDHIVSKKSHVRVQLIDREPAVSPILLTWMAIAVRYV